MRQGCHEILRVLCFKHISEVLKLFNYFLAKNDSELNDFIKMTGREDE